MTKVSLGNPFKIIAKDTTLETRFKARFDPLVKVGPGDRLKARFKARFKTRPDPPIVFSSSDHKRTTKGTPYIVFLFYKLAVVKKVLQISLPLVI